MNRHGLKAQRASLRAYGSGRNGPGEDAVEYEVVLIAAYVDEKIHRLWELTWPDWTTAKAFRDYS